MGEIKICGTTSETDLEIAALAGASEVGIIYHPFRQTRHTIDEQEAIKLITSARLFPYLRSTLIPRLRESAEILEVMKLMCPDRVQLGETEDPELTKNVSPPQSKVRPPIPISQVVHVGDETEIADIDQFSLYVDRLHLDSAGASPGGNGTTHDWTISRKITERAHAMGKTVMLSGGLSPENVGEAIMTVRSDGVDVETGIKNEDGSHDPELVASFIKEAQAAFNTLENVQ